MAHYKGAQYWESKIASHPENGRAHRNLAPLYAERAALLREPGAADAALDHLRKAVHYDQQSDAARNDLGVALLKAGKIAEAQAHFEEGLMRTPRSAFLHKNLAAVHARHGAFKQALVHANEATRLAPQDPQAHRNLARILDRMGNTRDALWHNRKALALGPAHMTGGRVKDAADTDTYRVVARQAVARGEYANGKGHCEAHHNAFRALAGRRFVLPFSEVTRELKEKAGFGGD